MKKVILSFASNILFSYVFDIIIDLIFDRLLKFKNGIDWDKVETDMIQYIRDRINVLILEEVVIKIAQIILNEVKFIFSDVLLCDKIWSALKRGEYKKAVKLLKKNILSRLKTGVWLCTYVTIVILQKR